MSTVTALNQPQRCIQELSDFDCAMGWAFQDLSVHDEEYHEDEFDRVHREHKRREHTHTAFDKRVELPVEFVAPRATNHLHHHLPQQKPNKSTVRSAAYSKRATGPTARLSSRQDTTTTKKSATVAVDRPYRSTCRRGRSRSRSPPPRQEEEEERVDFVYDVAVRKALRDRLDAERVATLRRAEAKETTLRAEHKWVYDTGPAARKHAWPPSPHKKPTPTTRRPVSAKTAIAPNVSEWRTQETPFHPSAATQRAERKRREQQLRDQTRRDADEMTHSLAAFEQQWVTP